MTPVSLHLQGQSAGNVKGFGRRIFVNVKANCHESKTVRIGVAERSSIGGVQNITPMYQHDFRHISQCLFDLCSIDGD